MATNFVCKIYKHFENLTDKRVLRQTNHDLLEMVFLTLCAVICDANTWADVERFGKAKTLEATIATWNDFNTERGSFADDHSTL